MVPSPDNEVSSPSTLQATPPTSPSDNSSEKVGLGSILKLVIRSLLIAYLVNLLFHFLFSNFVGESSTETKKSEPAGYLNAWSASQKLVPTPFISLSELLSKLSIVPLFASLLYDSSRLSSEYVHSITIFSTSMDLYVYGSLDPVYTDFRDPTLLFWKLSGIEYGNWNKQINKTIRISPIPPSLYANGIYYCHAYVTKFQSPPDPTHPEFQRGNVIHRTLPLTKQVQKSVQSKGLGEIHKKTTHGNNSTGFLSSTSSTELTNCWNGNISLHLVIQDGALQPQQLPDLVRPFFQFDQSKHTFLPPLYLNDFWTVQESLQPISKDIQALDLHLDYYPLSMFKFQAYLSASQAFTMQEQVLGAHDVDELRRMFRDTHPSLLLLTFTITLLHSLFEWLAFKNDVQFWRKRNDLHGISVRSLFVNVVVQLIILLYLLDQRDKTSYILLISNGMGLLIEVWKLSRAVKLKLEWIPHRWWCPIQLQWHAQASYADTSEIDQQAFKYLQYIIYPSMVMYSVYQWVYHDHARGVYSFFVSTAVGFVYAFSFLQLTPQLFINYKLKSVAHLNARTLTYKFLTTIIDDLYSFVIQMPTWHRIAVFRDDVVFVVYVVQRYKYRVDYSRPNEYGQIAGKDPPPSHDIIHSGDGAPNLNIKSITTALETKKSR